MARTILSNFLKGKHTTGQMYNLIKYLLGKKNTVLNWDPIYISVFLTYSCNLSCDMCLTHSTKHDNRYGQKPCKDMDFETFVKVLNKYKNALVVTLIGNGEPLLNKDYFKMIEYAAKRMNMYVFSVSNGVLLGKYSDQIVNSCLTWFNISINAHNSEEYHRMTGMPPEYFHVIERNICKLVKLRYTKNERIRIWISIILDKINYNYLSDMVNFAENLGVDGVLFFNFLPNEKEGFRAVERCLFKDNKNVLDIFSNITASKHKIKIILPILLDRSNNNKYCRGPFYNLTIDGEGNIGGCSCQLLDNSKNGKFYEENAWNNAYFRKFRRRFIDPNLSILEPCKWCTDNTASAKKTLLDMIKENLKSLVML